eukprot:GHVU01217174.1.p1 GENE.GHVU01217174.1~~GHVU01217174.1.p1  ORF type:complete len:124 (+),score=11.67 GHVU01217174.1:1-372(+)
MQLSGSHSFIDLFIHFHSLTHSFIHSLLVRFSFTVGRKSSSWRPVSPSLSRCTCSLAIEDDTRILPAAPHPPPPPPLLKTHDDEVSSLLSERAREVKLAYKGRTSKNIKKKRIENVRCPERDC